MGAGIGFTRTNDYTVHTSFNFRDVTLGDSHVSEIVSLSCTVCLINVFPVSYTHLNTIRISHLSLYNLYITAFIQFISNTIFVAITILTFPYGTWK